MYGTMKQEVSLAGVHGMVLEAGRRVRLKPAINLPNNGTRRWYASPADGRWSDGVDRNPDDSILVDEDDVEVDGGNSVARRVWTEAWIEVTEPRSLAYA